MMKAVGSFGFDFEVAAEEMGMTLAEVEEKGLMDILLDKIEEYYLDHLFKEPEIDYSEFEDLLDEEWECHPKRISFLKEYKEWKEIKKQYQEILKQYGRTDVLLVFA